MDGKSKKSVVASEQKQTSEGNKRSKNRSNKAPQTQQRKADDLVEEISIDERHKLVPEGNDFKLVFISSDSSKESELNSSLEENHPGDKAKKEVGEEVEEMDWADDFAVATASSPKVRNNMKRTIKAPPPPERPPALPPKSKKRLLMQGSPNGARPTYLLDDFHFGGGKPSPPPPVGGARSALSGVGVTKSGGFGEKFVPTAITAATAAAANNVHLNSLYGSSSTASGSIRTAATRDRNSPLRDSPRIPKVHKIPIKLRLASGGGGNVSEAGSQDLEVQDILGSSSSVKKKKNKKKNKSEDVDDILSCLNRAEQDVRERVLQQTGAYVEMARAAGGKNNNQAASFEDRSLGEMSIHDQLVMLRKEVPAGTQPDKDPKVSEYRSALLEEIKAMQAAMGMSTRSLSESDLSEIAPGGPSPSGDVTEQIATVPYPSSQSQSHRSGPTKEVFSSDCFLPVMPPPPVLPPKMRNLRRHQQPDPHEDSGVCPLAPSTSIGK